MAIVYKHLRSPKNSTSGLSDTILIAHRDWFEELACPTPNDPAVTLDTATVILDDHVFKEGKGFIELQCAPFKNNIAANSIGEVGSTSFDKTLNATIPGSYEELHATIAHFKNQPIIALVKDGNCGEDMWYQLGCDCKSAWMTASFSTGDGKGGFKGYTISLNVEQDAIVTYAGEVTKMPEPPTPPTP